MGPISSLGLPPGNGGARNSFPRTAGALAPGALGLLDTLGSMRSLPGGRLSRDVREEPVDAGGVRP